jgi:succinate-semialdehyde dehydrogenase/glutarate-semialdehyde dehydrogenase
MPGAPLERSVIDELDRDLHSSRASSVPVFSPFSGELLHDLPLSAVSDVQDATARAQVAQLGWQESGWAHRRRLLLRAHDLLLDRRELLLDAVQTETGKTRGQAFEEIFMGANVTRYYAVSTRATLRTRHYRSGIPFVLSTRVEYSPKGVIAVITPWNYPLSLALMDVIPALAAGNAVIQKADNQGALSILAARRAFIDAGLPSELWSVVAGDGAEIGGAVISASDYVCFTGSTATGRVVAAQAATALIGASLELGGKNPLIVLDDVDPKRAAAGAVYACFASLGQLCVSIERIYVHRAVADAFIPEFVAQTASLVQGAAFDYTTDVGSLTLPSQLERVQAHVDDAIAKGATVLTGGKARPDLGPLFYEPTVLTNVTEEMACVVGETFGPVVAITVVDSVEKAITAANASPYGLNASIFTGSRHRGREFASAIEAGSVNINEGYRASFSSIDAPMGGMKQSGLGRRNGKVGLLRFVEARTVAESTGLLTLPRTGRDFQKMTGLMVTLLRALKALRRR